MWHVTVMNIALFVPFAAVSKKDNLEERSLTMMDKGQFALLELLKASLFETEPVLPDDLEWESVLYEAQAKQGTA